MNKTIILLISFILSVPGKSQNVGIGTNSPAASAQLDVNSTTKGFLPPRLTIKQRDSIANPSAGLVIFCSECDELEVYNGVIWKTMGDSAACKIPTSPFVKICNQIWMTKNLDVVTYLNGDTIPHVSDAYEWSNLITGAWCWYNNDSATYAASYGKLYNGRAITDPRGLAPLGWHVASDAEWSALATCLGGDTVSATKIKEAGTTHWTSPNSGATNSSGFTALPGGYRDYYGAFHDIGDKGYFWTSRNLDGFFQTYCFLIYNKNYLATSAYWWKQAFSVRCLKD